MNTGVILPKSCFMKDHRPDALRFPVLIVGGGLTGLSAALFLLKQGIRPLLMEKHIGTSIHPHAREFDIRTMELLRESGLSEPVRDAGKLPGPSRGFLFGRSLAEAPGKKSRRKGEAITHPVQISGMEGLAALKPEMGARCPQGLSEPVLLAAAKERGAHVRFHTELASFEQNDTGIIALIKDHDTGETQKIHADYMIAADGAKSPVGEVLQVSPSGKGALGDLVDIYCEADLAAFVRDREFSMFVAKTPEIRRLLTSIDNSGHWVFHLYFDRVKGERPEDFTTERLPVILQEVIGLPGLSIRIITVLPWQPTIKVVDDVRHGRVFLAGDAAHVMTPYGGKGAATGIQDVHNLAWKLATVLDQWVSPFLPETYSKERQPIGLFNAFPSGKMADKPGLPQVKRPVNIMLLARFLDALGPKKQIQKRVMKKMRGRLGIPEYDYHSTAITEENEDPGGKNDKNVPLTAAPGTRAPSISVIHKGKKISTLDLPGGDFVLFTGSGNEARQKAARDAQDLKTNIPVYSIGNTGSLIFADAQAREVLKLFGTGAVLVRPEASWHGEAPKARPTLPCP
jgi:2-polyprenyl-6-methoxyphenol hydroxylase-like FAD-dependent oxidoreductase